MTQSDRAALAALTALIVLHAIMLSSLFAGVPPHPPARTPLFGMGPFLGAMLSSAAASMWLGPLTTRAGRVLAMVAMALSLVSFGPQKLADAALPLIWPTLAAAWIALAALALLLIRNRGIAQ